MKVKVAFAHKVDEPDYTEVLLTEVEERIPSATAWAEANGYVVRVAEIDLDTPPLKPPPVCHHLETESEGA